MKVSIVSILLCFIAITSANLNKCRKRCYQENFVCVGMAEDKGAMLQCLVNKYTCKESCYKKKISSLRNHLKVPCDGKSNVKK